jgi:hypothetical protein
MYLQGHYFDIIHRNGEEHFDADSVSRILQSGDIDEALEAADLDEPDDKEVTMRDLKNLNTLLKLQLSQYGYLKGNTKSLTPVNVDQANSIILDNYNPEGMYHAKDRAECDIFLAESILDMDIVQGAREEVQVNMTSSEKAASHLDRSTRLEAWNAIRDKGFIEAQEKAREAQFQISERRLAEQRQLLIDERENQRMQDDDETSEEEVPLPSGDEVQEMETYDVQYDDEGFGLEENIEDRYKGVQDDPQRILLQSGPHRWTPATMNEYVERYVPLEGKLWVHPRTKRLYQITNVFFYEKYQLAAAYSRVRDGGQPDPTDQYPHRIAGTMGLEELVAAFESSGGSQGISKTRWPKSEQQWSELQEQDATLGPIILKLKEEREQLLARLPDTPPIMTKEEKAYHEERRRQIVTYSKEKGRVLIYDGVLRAEPLDKRHPNLQYVVPTDLRQNVIELYHDSMGHPGTERTLETVRLSYWWHGMTIDIETHVKGCKACARRKAYNRNAAVPIQEYDSPTMPWQRAHVDVTGRLTITHNGNEYILVIKDALTRFVETAAMKTKSAEEVVKALVNSVIYRHGAVQLLISDNGGEFDNKLWAQVTQLLQIEHSTTSPYNPRANGLVENHMRTLKDAIGIYCDESQKDWDEHLAGTTMSYNTTVNSQTGFTPYYMMYGREARLPSESWLRHFSKVKGIQPYVQDLVKGLVRVWDEVSSKKHDEVVVMQKGQKPINHLKYCEYREGDYAMISMIPKTKTLGWIDTQYRQVNLKLQPRYAGPYLILRKVSPVVYVLEVDGTEKTFHAVNMKPYQGKKDALTPFVEPGYERMEAGEMREPETPLLLSPDEELNRKASSGYQRKKLSAKQQTTKDVNAARKRADREEQTKQRLSNSRSEGIWIMADNDEAESDTGEDEVNESSDGDNYAVGESKGGDSQGDWLNGEVNMIVMHDNASISSIIQAVEDDSNSNSAGEVQSFFNLHQRSQIFAAAQIDETVLLDNDNKRLDKWIDIIDRKERIRKTALTERERHLESEIATEYEYIGWILRQYVDQWTRMYPSQERMMPDEHHTQC